MCVQRHIECLFCRLRVPDFGDPIVDNINPSTHHRKLACALAWQKHVGPEDSERISEASLYHNAFTVRQTVLWLVTCKAGFKERLSYGVNDRNITARCKHPMASAQYS